MGTLLAISLAFNALVGWAYLDQRDATTEATQSAVTARAAAAQCSRAVEGLQAAAAQRAQDAAAARAEADSRASVHDAEADTVLATGPAVPGQACQSAQVRINAWKAGAR